MLIIYRVTLFSRNMIIFSTSTRELGRLRLNEIGLRILLTWLWISVFDYELLVFDFVFLNYNYYLHVRIFDRFGQA